MHEAFIFDTSSDEFINWKNSSAHLALSQMIVNNFHLYETDRSQGRYYDVMQNPKMAGISLNLSQLQLKRKELIFFTSYLIEKLKDEQYILPLSEIKSRSISDNIEEVLKAYLKPSRKLVREEKAEQLFGNVSIEIKSINARLDRFNLSCSYYQDQHFHPANPFYEFVEKIIAHE